MKTLAHTARSRHLPRGRGNQHHCRASDDVVPKEADVGSPMKTLAPTLEQVLLLMMLWATHRVCQANEAEDNNDNQECNPSVSSAPSAGRIDCGSTTIANAADPVAGASPEGDPATIVNPLGGSGVDLTPVGGARFPAYVASGHLPKCITGLQWTRRWPLHLPCVNPVQGPSGRPMKGL